MKKRYILAIALAFMIMGGAYATHAASTPTLMPILDGSFKQWAPKFAGSHYVMVDDNPCNGQQDYNYTSTIGSRDSYVVDLSSVPDGSDIYGIAIRPCAGVFHRHKQSVLNVFFKNSAMVSADKGNYMLADSITQLPTTFFNVATGSFVKSPSSYLEVGAVLTSGKGGARLSNIQTTIFYTP